jgi:hypothetical protein
MVMVVVTVMMNDGVDGVIGGYEDDLQDIDDDHDGDGGDE